MITVEKSIVINRPLQEVFDYVTNPTNNVQWQRSTQSAEWTSDGPPGVGSTYKVVNRFLWRTMESTAEIMAWDPPNTLSAKAVSGPIPFEATYKFEAQGDGTKMTFTSQAEIGGFFKRLVSKQFEKQLDTSTNALKLVLESG
jgi:uncharacterized membrane protein